MNPKVKQRIIGALVLLFVIAIFLPIVFHNTRPMLNSHTLNQNLNDLDSNEGNTVKIPAPESAASPSSASPMAPSVQPTSAKIEDAPKPQEIENLERTVTHQPPISKEEDQTQAAPVEKPVAKKINKIEKTVSVEKSSKVIEEQTTATPHEPVIVNDMLLTEQPKAWVIQLGIFSNRQRAIKLLHELRVKKYQAYITHKEEDKAGSIRVNVGPLINRDRIKILQQNIKREFKINGLIKEYQP